MREKGQEDKVVKLKADTDQFVRIRSDERL